MTKPKNYYLKAFLIGSSFPVILLPFLYLGISTLLNPTTFFQFEYAVYGLPILFGFINMLQLAIKKYFIRNNSELRYWTVGALYGLGLSLYASFIANIPQDLFKLPDTSVQYITIPLAVVGYALVWRYIVKNLNHLFELE